MFKWFSLDLLFGSFVGKSSFFEFSVLSSFFGFGLVFISLFDWDFLVSVILQGILEGVSLREFFLRVLEFLRLKIWIWNSVSAVVQRLESQKDKINGRENFHKETKI